MRQVETVVPATANHAPAQAESAQLSQPLELDLSLLSQVSGAGPYGGWATAGVTTDGPYGGWK